MIIPMADSIMYISDEEAKEIIKEILLNLITQNKCVIESDIIDIISRAKGKE